MPNLHKGVRGLYVRWVRPRLRSEIQRQRVKLAYDGWGYVHLLGLRSLSVPERVRLITQFLAIDWNIVHGHKPREIVAVCAAIASREARDDEAIVEAGCWQGGSSTKLSLVGARLGYHLHIYDSFQGVERVDEDGYDFGGEYASPEHVLRTNLARYGDASVCTIHKGWFRDTLGREPLEFRVRVAYIDCDLAKGTREALQGIVPALASDGVVFSQDVQIRSVRELLSDPTTWADLGRAIPVTRHVYRNLARLEFPT